MVNKILYSAIVLSSLFLLTGCGSKTKVSNFSDDSALDTPVPYVDKYADATIKIAEAQKLNQEFKAVFKTYDPDGSGEGSFKARSLKEIPLAGKNAPESGQKLILVEISVQGNSKNRGFPSTFNQVGDRPSPQFVLIDKSKNKSYVETTYYSDAYTVDKKLFELSKITTDQTQWVHTALVFQIDKNLTPDLAFRFVNPNGETVFYDITE